MTGHLLRRAGTWLLAALLLAGCGAQPPAPVAASAPATREAAVTPAPSASARAAAPASAPLTGCLTRAPGAPQDARRVTVRRVVDGDTVELQDGTRVRLIGVNTPESVDPRRPVQIYGKEASAHTRELLEGRQVLLAEGQTPRDKYGRTLAWLWLADGRFVNALLVQEGYAQVYTFADNPDHAPLLLACQREAREASRGLWSLAEYQNGQQAASAPPSSAPVPAPTPAVVAPAPVAAEPVKAAAGVTIVKEPGTVGRNRTASVTAQTAPGASCSIVVRYKSGPSEAQGLGPRQAGTDGKVSWSWKVGGNTSPGTWPVTVTCNGQRAQTAVTVP